MIEVKKKIVEEITELEWTMFRSVNNYGGKAACQSEKKTFYIMRLSQHMALELKFLESYLNDLKEANKEGRNVMTEKYAYMMEITDPVWFKKKLEENLPSLSLYKIKIINDILVYINMFEKEMNDKYPNFSRNCRPIETSSGVDSELYISGELKTYSIQSLELYLANLKKMKYNQENLVHNIFRNISKLYGYDSLDEAEREMSLS